MAGKFKLGLIVGNHPDRPPQKIAPGYDFGEICMDRVCVPLHSDAIFAQRRAEVESWHLASTPVAGYFASREFGLVPLLGPTVDEDLLGFYCRRGFARLATMGASVIGIFGAMFQVPTGTARADCVDQAQRVANLIGECARQSGITVALEPSGTEDELCPRYLDGIAFVRELGHPNVKVMADFEYFFRLPQALEDIAQHPEHLVHVHISDTDHRQPGAGSRPTARLFRILSDIGYEGTVAIGAAWAGDFAEATADALTHLRRLRDSV